jgi:hypothetical protein
MDGMKAGAWSGGKERRGLRPGLFWPVVLAIVFSGVAARAAGETTGEYQVKAAFLFHFAQFVEWPADAFGNATSPLTYCLREEDPFHGALDEALKGKSIGGRELRMRHLKRPEPVEGCHVLFIGNSDPKRLEEDLASTRGRAVLTVGDTESFSKMGGIIGFCLEERKVRFDINLESAGKARLKISAKLLSLAKTVTGTP